MSEKTPQTLQNHAKMVAPFHYVLLPILLINLLLSIYHSATAFSMFTAWSTFMAVALIMIALFARIFALQAQDRVIRLEERMRLQTLLPDELKPRIHDFTMDQLAALRFASDNELPNLAGKVLEDGINDRKAIKELIVTWRADYQRL
jgi:uncharacterized membrane protein